MKEFDIPKYVVNSFPFLERALHMVPPSLQLIISLHSSPRLWLNFHAHYALHALQPAHDITLVSRPCLLRHADNVNVRKTAYWTDIGDGGVGCCERGLRGAVGGDRQVDVGRVVEGDVCGHLELELGICVLRNVERKGGVVESNMMMSWEQLERL